VGSLTLPASGQVYPSRSFAICFTRNKKSRARFRRCGFAFAVNAAYSNSPIASPFARIGCGRPRWSMKVVLGSMPRTW